VLGLCGFDGSQPLKCELMVEEYLDGTEVDIDVVLCDGKAVYNKVTDNWPTLEPWFNETGDNAPSLFEREKQLELEQLAEGTLKCLGFTTGVFHVEVSAFHPHAHGDMRNATLTARPRRREGRV
jgi:hypothetical protein